MKALTGCQGPKPTPGMNDTSMLVGKGLAFPKGSIDLPSNHAHVCRRVFILLPAAMADTV